MSIPLLEMDPEGERRQLERLARRAPRTRQRAAGRSGLAALRHAAAGHGEHDALHPGCVRAYATLGEICDVFREVFGEYREPAII